MVHSDLVALPEYFGNTLSTRNTLEKEEKADSDLRQQRKRLLHREKQASLGDQGKKLDEFP